MKGLVAALLRRRSSSLSYFPGHHVSVRCALLQTLDSGCAVSPTRSQWLSQTESVMYGKHFSTLLRSNMLSPNLNIRLQKEEATDVTGKEGHHVTACGGSFLQALHSGCSQAINSKKFSTLIRTELPYTLPRKEEPQDVKGKESLFVYQGPQKLGLAHNASPRKFIFFKNCVIATQTSLFCIFAGLYWSEIPETFQNILLLMYAYGFCHAFAASKRIREWRSDDDPYVHELRWQPGSDHFEVDMMTYWGKYTTRTIKLADINREPVKTDINCGSEQPNTFKILRPLFLVKLIRSVMMLPPSSNIILFTCLSLYTYWRYDSYLHRLKFVLQPDGDGLGFEAHMKPVNFSFDSGIVHEYLKRPMVTFMADGKPYCVDGEFFDNKELLAKLDPTPDHPAGGPDPGAK